MNDGPAVDDASPARGGLAPPSWDLFWQELHRRDPAATSPIDLYADWVRDRGRGRRWLDAGCGRRSLPRWRSADVEALAASGTEAFGCDLDLAALRDRERHDRICGATLDHLPFRDQAFDLVTCNMVFEHLDHPELAVAELARVTRPGGEIVIHTVNARHYLSWVARLTPFRFHRLVVARLEGRKPEDVYPTRYRANTVERLRALFAAVGCSHVAGGLVAGIPYYVPYRPLFRPAIRLGLLERRLGGTRLLAGLLRPNLLVAFRREKGDPTPRAGDAVDR